MKKFIFTLLFILSLNISTYHKVHAEINRETVKIVFDSTMKVYNLYQKYTLSPSLFIIDASIFLVDKLKENLIKDSLVQFGTFIKKNAFPDLQKKFANIRQKFNNVSNKVDQINTKVDQINTKVDQINTKVDQINTKVDQINTKVDQINTKVDQISTKIDSLDTKISIIQETIQQQSKEFQLVNEAIAEQLKVNIENQRLIKLSQNADFVSGIRSYKVAMDAIDKGDTELGKSHLAIAFDDLTKAEYFLADEEKQGKVVPIDQKATLYFHLASYYLYVNHQENVKKYLHQLLSLPIPNDVFDDNLNSINFKINQLKNDIITNRKNKNKVTQINSEIKNYSQQQNSIQNYKTAYLSTSEITRAYREIAKDYLKALGFNDQEVNEFARKEFEETQDLIEIEMFIFLTSQHTK